MTPSEKIKILWDSLTNDDKPKLGKWISFEDHLPPTRFYDYVNGGTQYEVMYKSGQKAFTRFRHNEDSYIKAKLAGYTHWFNN